VTLTKIVQLLVRFRAGTFTVKLDATIGKFCHFYRDYPKNKFTERKVAVLKRIWSLC